jgi:hypothetical protein
MWRATEEIKRGLENEGTEQTYEKTVTYMYGRTLLKV